MPSIVKEVDASYANCFPNDPWSCWPVPTMPDVAVDPWAGLSVPWKEPVAGLPVNDTRTARLASVDIPISSGGGGTPWSGASTGFPYNIVSTKGTTTPVWDLSQAPVWSFSWATGFIRRDPIVQIPLPNLVRLEGDPNGAFDVHGHFYDPTDQVLWELIQVQKSFGNRLKTWGTTEWTAGYDGAAAISRWNCKIAWNAPGQPAGAVAIGVPQFPHVARWDEVKRGKINHALFMGVPNYSPVWTGYARGSDGTYGGHPLRGGERLRLRRSVVERFPLGTAARVLAEAAWEYGVVVGDRNTWDPMGGTAGYGKGGIAVSMDRRWSQGADGIGPLGQWMVRLADFDVVTPG